MAEAVRERVRECGCPPWVVQCVHCVGQVVYIAFLHGRYEAHGPTKVLVESNDPEVRRHIPCMSVAFSTEVLALEDFARRAELLRLGGTDA
ncbi:hypothetical protein LCGC14_1188920 [marine sediment metagenome]|uniref:Uncharacterized protein n=1 Tax=marine sediment metagenome TaxID=412755 RepID=A0A0F9LPX2_9ZZZZ